MPTEIRVVSGTESDGRPYYVSGALPGSGTENDGRAYLTVGKGGVGLEADGRAYMDLPHVLYIKIPTPFEEILVSGELHVTHKLYRSNVSGQELEELDVLAGGQFSVSNFRDHAWELSVPLDHLTKDYLFGDSLEVWVKNVIEVEDPDGPEPYQRFPAGLYLCRTEKGTRALTHSEWELVGKSPEVLLYDDAFPLGYVAPVGTGVLAEARSILIGLGVPPEGVVFPPASEDVVLTTQYVADAIQDPSSTRKLRVVNGLLNAGGFFAVYTDAEGRFRTKKIEDRPDRTPDVTYDRRHLAGDVDEEREIDERFGNRIVVQLTDPNFQAIVVAENRDPESPVSIPRMGNRIIQPDPIQVQNVVSIPEAERIAREYVRRAAALGRKLSFDALPDPRRGPKETYRLEFTNDAGEVVALGSYYPVGFQAPRGLGSWKHEVGVNARVEP